MLGYEPRKLTAQDCTVLCNLAGMVIKEIQKDQLLMEKENSGQVLQRRNSRLNVGGLWLHIYCACSSLTLLLLFAPFASLHQVETPTAVLLFCSWRHAANSLQAHHYKHSIS